MNNKAWKVAPEAYLERRPSQYAVRAPSSEYITMRDGCRLAADVYLPQASSEKACYPAILVFTPYYRRFRCTDATVEAAPQAAWYRNFFVPRGYALVVVDVRGTGASFGTRDSLRSPEERLDYGEVAEWVTRQAWSDGRVGATGISYPGAASCFLASTAHPAVRAIAPLFAISDIYSEQIYPGGMTSKIWTVGYQDVIDALDQDDRERVHSYAATQSPALQGPQPVDDDVDGVLLAQAVREHRHNFNLNDFAAELMFRDEGTLHDPELRFLTCSPCHTLLQTPEDCAIYSVSGWFDGGGYANAAISRFLTAPSKSRYLLLGPWDHGAQTDISPWRERVVPDFPLLSELLRFFDHHLMGLETGLDQEEPVHYFSVHAEQWHAAPAWPPVKGQLTLYPGQHGALSPAPASTSAHDGYAADFAFSTGRQTRWERLGGIVVETYYGDWHEREADLLSYTTDAFDEALEITGHITANLSLRCSQPDASLFVFASEVDAQGRSHYITEGMLRAIHRQLSDPPLNYRTTWPFRSYARADMKRLQPGKQETIVIPLLPVSWTLPAGSRLRFSIAGADRQHFPCLPHGRPPRLEIVRGGEAATHFTVPCRRAISCISISEEAKP